MGWIFLLYLDSCACPTQHLNFIFYYVERARPFSFCKGNIHWKIFSHRETFERAPRPRPGATQAMTSVGNSKPDVTFRHLYLSDTRAQFHRAAKHTKNGNTNQISTLFLLRISKQQLKTSNKQYANGNLVGNPVFIKKEISC